MRRVVFYALASLTAIETMHHLGYPAGVLPGAAGIEIPFPHRTLYAGSETPPLPVRVVTDEDA